MGSKGKACEIGIFDSEEEAALRYDQVAISLGKTILNFSPAPIAPGQDSPTAAPLTLSPPSSAASLGLGSQEQDEKIEDVERAVGRQVTDPKPLAEARSRRRADRVVREELHEIVVGDLPVASEVDLSKVRRVQPHPHQRCLKLEGHAAPHSKS